MARQSAVLEENLALRQLTAELFLSASDIRQYFQNSDSRQTLVRHMK